MWTIEIYIYFPPKNIEQCFHDHNATYDDINVYDKRAIALVWEYIDE